jgi:hypothetical protein
MSRPLLGVIALALVAAACAGGASAAGGGEPTLRIAAPRDGASVHAPFTVHLDSSVPLGDPSTGEHHVHLCFDGGSCDTEYTLVYGGDIVVKDLSPGEHTIEASLRNADHSDAGPHTTITVVVTGGQGAMTSSPASATGASGGRGYGS